MKILQTSLRVARYLCAFALALAASLFAQNFATTTVQGTVYLANGKPASGTVQITWPAFTTAAGQAVAAGRTTQQLGADGFLSIALAPNQGSTPAGLYYTVVYNLSDGSTNTEYWTIPAAAQAAVAQVRAQVMPAAQAVQAVSKAYVDQAVQQVAKAQINSGGGTLTGPLYLDGDPANPSEAADKHYVDTQFAQALPKSGGIAYGPITATQLGAVYQVDQMPGSDFGAQLQACIDSLAGTSGGTCDARNYPGVLTIANNVTVSTANLALYLPCATITTAASFIVTPGTRNVTLHGCASRGASAVSGSQGGTVFAYSGSGLFFQIGDPAYLIDTLGFHLDNVVVNTTSAPSPTAQALAAYRTQEMHLESLYLLGNANQTGITLDGTGNYTGGTFTDVELVGFQIAINAIGHQAANSATTDWLNASTFLRPHIDCPTSGGNLIAGTIGINLAQGDGNTVTGGDIEGCATALHLGPNAQNNTIVGLRTENSTSQVVADSGSSYNNWVSGGTMFTGKLTDNGTRNSFTDTFHRSFNSLNGDWFGTQQDATLTNHFRLGIGAGNERGLLNRYQTDYGYRWTNGFSDATGGAQYYQLLDELNNVYRLSVGQYNPGQSSTNNQTVVNAAGSGAVVLNGSNNAGTGGVVFGSGGASSTTVATVDKQGNANFTGTLQVGKTAQSAGTFTVRNNADAEVDYYLWPGLTSSQKGSFTYKDYAGNSQWYMVKDASNNWALNSAIGGLDSFKAYQSSNSGDTYINASNSSGVVRVNYETGAGSAFNIYGGSSSNLYASFTAPNAIKFPGLAASSGKNCLHIDSSGYISNTGVDCSTGGSVNPGTLGQLAYYAASGVVLAGLSTVPLSAGGTGAADPAAAIANLGALPAAGGTMTGQLNGTSATFSGTVQASNAVRGPVQDNGGQVFNLYAYGAVSDAKTDTTCSMTAGSAALTCTDSPFSSADVGKPIGVQFAGPTASGWADELVTTIAAYTDANHVTLAAAASSTTPSGMIDPAGLSLANAGTSGYYSGAWATTTSGVGTGAVVSFDAGTQGGVVNTNTPSVPYNILYEGAGYAVGDKIYPTVSGSSGDAYFTVTRVNGTGIVWGTDNSAAFANWMKACGGTTKCLIPYGNFLFAAGAANANKITVPSNTTIEMDPQGAIYLQGVPSRSGGANNWGVFGTPNGAQNIHLRGLHFEGENRVGLASILDNPGFISLGYNNVNVQITDGILAHSQGHGITGYSNGGSGVLVTRNYCFHNNNTCFNTDIAGIKVTDNTLVNDGGIEIGGNPLVNVDHNVVINATALSAMAVGGSTSGSDYSCGTLSNNIIRNPLRSGIHIADGCSHATIDSNSITGLTGWFSQNIGITHAYSGYVHSDANKISNNFIRGAVGSGNAPYAGIYICENNAPATNGDLLVGNDVKLGTGSFAGLYVNCGSSGLSSSGNVWGGGNYDLSLGNSGNSTLAANDTLVNGNWTYSSPSLIEPASTLRSMTASATNSSGTVFFGDILFQQASHANSAYAPYKILPFSSLVGATNASGSYDSYVQLGDNSGVANDLACFDSKKGITDCGIAKSAVGTGGGSSGGSNVVAKINLTTYSGTTSQWATIYTPAAQGLFQLCGYIQETAAATGGSSFGLGINYTSSGHNSGNISMVTQTATVTTQWSINQGCLVFAADAGVAINAGVQMNSLTGSPGFLYGFSLIQLQ